MTTTSILARRKTRKKFAKPDTHCPRRSSSTTSAASAQKDADQWYPDNAALRDQHIARAIGKGCPFTVNLVAHRMGNYLFKHVLQSSVHQGGRQLLFDNVTLVAADTNNEGHADWVDVLNCRNRIYITINEDDAALMASRMKPGAAQKARLGTIRSTSIPRRRFT